MTAFDLHIVFDCADPHRVALFWREALGDYDFPMPVPDGFTSWDAWADAQGIPVDQRPTGRTLIDKVRDRPDIFFLKVPESKSGKNRLHLDIKAAPGLEGSARRAKIEEEATRLTALGATILHRTDDPTDFHLVMQDPERNEFCIT